MWTALASLVLATAAPNLHLIPSPQSVSLQPGMFPLERHVSLRVINKADAFTAEQLIEESPTSFGWGGSDSIRVYVTKLGADSTLDAKLKRYWKRRLGQTQRKRPSNSFEASKVIALGR